MPNHYHLLVQLVDSQFSERMKSLGISYAKAINAMYGHVGHVFEGRFKAKCVTSDEYLLNVSRYIHLNPLFGGLVQNAADWEYSSYSVYLPSSKRDSKQGIRIARSAILSHFSGCEEYMRFVELFGEEKMREMEDSLW